VLNYQDGMKIFWSRRARHVPRHAMGFDRRCMMLLGEESVRGVILFPQLKPK